GSRTPGALDGRARSAVGTPRRPRRAPSRSDRSSPLHPSPRPLALMFIGADTNGVAEWATETAQFPVGAVSVGARRHLRKERAMAGHTIGTREEWLAKRDEL